MLSHDDSDERAIDKHGEFPACERNVDAATRSAQVATPSANTRSPASDRLTLSVSAGEWEHRCHMDWWQRGGDARCNLAGDDGRNDPGGRCGKDATRQVLEHLALEAVVIGGMSRATGNGRRIDVLMRLECVRMVVRSRMCRRRLRKPRQRTERWPGQRNERDPSDNRFYSPHIEPS